MAQKSTKQAFKQYLQQKQAATKCLSKAEQNKVHQLEEHAIVKRIKKRERYASDEVYRTKQQECAKLTMRKKREAKKNDVPHNDEVVEEFEQQPQTPEPTEQEIIPFALRFNPRNLF